MGSSLLGKHKISIHCSVSALRGSCKYNQSFKSSYYDVCQSYSRRIEAIYIYKTDVPVAAIENIPNQSGRFLDCFSRSVRLFYREILLYGEVKKTYTIAVATKS